MISHLRAALRLVLVALFLVARVIVHLVGLIFLWTGPSRRRWRRLYLRQSARGVVRILGIEVETHGRLPVGGGILVTNHLGYVDVLVLAATLDAVFVSRADVRDWPVLGPMVTLAGTIYLDRGRGRAIPSALARMQRELDQGAIVVFFPEGTSSDGRRVLPFKPSLFQVATQMDSPVRAAALGYHVAVGEPAAETSVAWWREDVGFGEHFWRLLRLSRITARLVFAPDVMEPSHMDRKQLCRQAEAAVRGALVRRWELDDRRPRS